MTKAFNSAMRLLTRREHSAIELYNKLLQRGFSHEEAQEAIARCESLGLQSDSRFVESFIRVRIRQGYGPVKISLELRSKGIDSDLIQTEIEKECENWFNYALHVWHKRNKGRKDLSFDEIQKQQRFLLSRGFSMDIIAAVAKEQREME